MNTLLRKNVTQETGIGCTWSGAQREIKKTIKDVLTVNEIETFAIKLVSKASATSQLGLNC